MSSETWPTIVKPLASQRNVRIRWSSFQRYSSLKKLWKFVSTYPSRNPSLSAAADIAGLSRIYFSAYFHQKTGVTFKYWIDFVRVARAAKLLQETDLQIAEIAFQCGFNDATTFTRTFRRILNRKPLEFRKSLGSRVRGSDLNNRRKILNKRRKNLNNRRNRELHLM